MNLGILRCFVLAALVCGVAAAGPAPAPSLQSPASGAANVDPDPTLTWQWTDDLVTNGSFEKGLTPGWYTGGNNPGIWELLTDTTNRYGMGYNWATTYMPLASSAMGQLIQDVYIPADATSATLRWSEQVMNIRIGSQSIGRFRVWLAQGGNALTILEDVTGLEPIFNHGATWVSRSTNLLAYAGQSFQLIFQANSYSPYAADSWWVSVDGVSFSCDSPSSRPAFQVYVGKNLPLRATNLVGTTSELTFSSVALAPSSLYYWCVGAVRDGVTNVSSGASFVTRQRVLPKLTVTRRSSTGVRLSFPTHANRYYTVEQAATLGGTLQWYDAVAARLGDGTPMEVEVPMPGSDPVFWRLRVTP